MRNAAEFIRNNISMYDVVEMYDLKSNKANFINCPFHNEKTPSLKVYKQPGRGWHCFGCGKGGSVIDFVMELYGLNFQQSIVKMNIDFSLGFAFKNNMTLREKHKIRQQKRALQERREYEIAIDEALLHYDDWLWIEWERLTYNKKKYRPKRNEPLHLSYIEAVRKLSHHEYLLDTADTHLAHIKKDLLNNYAAQAVIS